MKRTSKVLSAILALVLIVCAVFCISVFAENNGATLGYANVVYGDQISLAFTVEGYTGDGPVGIAVYKKAGDATPEYVSFEVKELQGVEYFETFGIAAKDIDTDYYVAVAEKDEAGTITLLSEKKAYSVKQYAEDSIKAIEAIEEPTEHQLAQKAVYKAILNYNKAADAVIPADAN